MTTIEQEVDVFLEHFGAKGMKWGVRKAQVKQTFSKSNPHAKRNKRIAAGVAITGAAIVGIIVARKSGVRMSSLKRTHSTTSGSKHSAQLLAKMGKERFEAIPMPPVFSATDRKNHRSQILQRNALMRHPSVTAANKAKVAAFDKSYAKQVKGMDQQLMIGDQAKRGISNFPTVGARPWQRD